MPFFFLLAKKPSVLQTLVAIPTLICTDFKWLVVEEIDQQGSDTEVPQHDTARMLPAGSLQKPSTSKVH